MNDGFEISVEFQNYDLLVYLNNGIPKSCHNFNSISWNWGYQTNSYLWGTIYFVVRISLGAIVQKQALSVRMGTLKMTFRIDQKVNNTSVERKKIACAYYDVPNRKEQENVPL